MHRVKPDGPFAQDIMQVENAAYFVAGVDHGQHGDLMGF
jgi:hypothetical protein